jgi:ABC-type antimicrobial peptide transport system permease subunit
MNFIRKKDLGYNGENVICFATWGMQGHANTVRSELQKNPNITGIATANFQNMISKNYNMVLTWQGQEKPLKFNVSYVDFDFLQVMNIPLIDGQTPPESSAEKYCLLNETAIREMQLKDPLNQTITYMNENYTISGIVKDFNFEVLNQAVMPQIIFCSKENQQYYFYVKTTAQGTKSALTSIENLWKQFSPNLLFNYSFLDENYDWLYKTDIRMSTLLYIFAFIAIMISCLGLFGLVTYTAETKTKEIGIRKVLGAKISDIITMLTKEFLILVGIAMLIAFPLAYYWLERMLQDYAYRIEISWWMFALAGIITVVLTLITVGWQALKAATANPVKAIKSE